MDPQGMGIDYTAIRADVSQSMKQNAADQLQVLGAKVGRSTDMGLVSLLRPWPAGDGFLALPSNWCPVSSPAFVLGDAASGGASHDQLGAFRSTSSSSSSLDTRICAAQLEPGSCRPGLAAQRRK